MEDKTERIPFLIFKEQSEGLDRFEREELETWLEKSKENKLWYNTVTSDAAFLHGKLDRFRKGEIIRVQGWEKLKKRAHIGKPKLVYLAAKRFQVAAAVTVLLGIGYLFWHFQHFKVQNLKNELASQTAITDVPPGETKAILVLADGRKITLDTAKVGKLAVQGMTTVSNNNGAITYTGVHSSETLYNTLITNRGEQSPPLTLSDGTKVWLNAGSSIHFPTAFPGKTRSVEISGEVYFEVAKDKTKPFHVLVGGLIVEVLGTHFNIMSYSDESSIRVTLLEGSVNVKAENKSGLLKPGQQADVTSGKSNKPEKITVKEADVEEAVSWKNGMTSFKDENIQGIMRKVSRWYDVDVTFDGNIPDRTFMGGIPRNTNLSDVLKVLEINNIHFLVDGKKITVIP